jgi:hypothetical protein
MAETNWIDRLYPRKNIDILKAYSSVIEESKKNQEVKLPIVKISLINGNEINGIISKINFNNDLISFISYQDRFHGDFTVIQFNSIVTITIKDVDLNESFLKAYESLPF